LLVDLERTGDGVVEQKRWREIGEEVQKGQGILQLPQSLI
jgi:hypothetical protein